MFSEKLKNYAEKYNLSPRDVLFAQLIAAGADRGDAYTAIYHRTNDKLTPEQSTTRAADAIKGSPAISLLIRDAKNKKQRKQTQTTLTTLTTIDETEQRQTIEAYKNRDSVLEKIILSTDGMSGKDELQGLLAIAKLQGFDKTKEEDEEEKRTFFLPWVSNCRACALMKAYQGVIGEKQG